jgi:hypothetical protein
LKDKWIINSLDNFNDNNPKSHDGFDSRADAVLHAQTLLQTYADNWELFREAENLISYIDLHKKEFVLYVQKVQRPAIYDITDPEISTREPDVVDMETLSFGDKIGRWMNVRMTVEILNPNPLDSINLEEVKKFAAQIAEFESGPVVFLPATATVTPFEPVLICYVASIQPDKKFKVYSDWGDTTDIERCARQGRKCRSETLARQLFPMLNDYEFMV